MGITIPQSNYNAARSARLAQLNGDTNTELGLVSGLFNFKQQDPTDWLNATGRNVQSGPTSPYMDTEGGISSSYELTDAQLGIMKEKAQNAVATRGESNALQDVFKEGRVTPTQAFASAALALLPMFAAKAFGGANNASMATAAQYGVQQEQDYLNKARLTQARDYQLAKQDAQTAMEDLNTTGAHFEKLNEKNPEFVNKRNAALAGMEPSEYMQLVHDEAKGKVDLQQAQIESANRANRPKPGEVVSETDVKAMHEYIDASVKELPGTDPADTAKSVAALKGLIRPGMEGDPSIILKRVQDAVGEHRRQQKEEIAAEGTRVRPPAAGELTDIKAMENFKTMLTDIRESAKGMDNNSLVNAVKGGNVVSLFGMPIYGDTESPAWEYYSKMSGLQRTWAQGFNKGALSENDVSNFNAMFRGLPYLDSKEAILKRLDDLAALQQKMEGNLFSTLSRGQVNVSGFTGNGTSWGAQNRGGVSAERQKKLDELAEINRQLGQGQ